MNDVDLLNGFSQELQDKRPTRGETEMLCVLDAMTQTTLGPHDLALRLGISPAHADDLRTELEIMAKAGLIEGCDGGWRHTEVGTLWLAEVRTRLDAMNFD